MMSTDQRTFPSGFLWGAATSSYQVEGNIYHNDWAYESARQRIPAAGRAVDFYQRYEDDFTTAKTLGHTAHRFSLEWSRIQPEEHWFDAEAIQYYKQMLVSLRAKGMKSVVTVHHFTNPEWFYKKGGWLHPDAVLLFNAYVRAVVKELASLVDYWITINEPLVFAYNGYVKGIWPPFQHSFSQAMKVAARLKEAHLSAYRCIHEAIPGAQVSFAKHVRVFRACRRGNIGQNHLLAYIRNALFNLEMVEWAVQRKALDFIGLNYYTVDFIKSSLQDLSGKECGHNHYRLKKNSLGWYVYPQGLTALLKRFSRYGLPIFITENGTTEYTDDEYREYVKSHVSAVYEAVQSGVPVMGYLWWSLIDNFEWDKGYDAHFGLVSVDGSLQRTIKPFAEYYKDICVHNRLSL